jgi:transcriptional regulator with XRE-family HTH domain
MSGHRYFDELEAKTPREKALVDAYERLTRAVMRLAELRAQRGGTQEQLARAMEVTQPYVSKIERNGDLFVSTLTHYVAALGGELHLRALFPDQGDVDLAVLKKDDVCGAISVSQPEPAVPRYREGSHE